MLGELLLQLGVELRELLGGVGVGGPGREGGVFRLGERRRRRRRQRHRRGVGGGGSSRDRRRRVQRLVHVPLARHRVDHGLCLARTSFDVLDGLFSLGSEFSRFGFVFIPESLPELLLVRAECADDLELPFVLLLERRDVLEVHERRGDHRGGVARGDGLGRERARRSPLELGDLVEQQLNLPGEVRGLRLQALRHALVVPLIRRVRPSVRLHPPEFDGGIFQAQTHLGVSRDGAFVLPPLLREHRRALLELLEHAVDGRLEPPALGALFAPRVRSLGVLGVELRHREILAAEGRGRRVGKTHGEQRARLPPARRAVVAQRRRGERVLVGGHGRAGVRGA